MAGSLLFRDPRNHIFPVRQERVIVGREAAFMGPAIDAEVTKAQRLDAHCAQQPAV